MSQWFTWRRGGRLDDGADPFARPGAVRIEQDEDAGDAEHDDSTGRSAGEQPAAHWAEARKTVAGRGSRHSAAILDDGARACQSAALPESGKMRYPLAFESFSVPGTWESG